MVTLTVSNQVSEEVTVRNYTLQRRVQNLALITADSSVTKNITVSWTVNFGSVGTDACYFLDLVDDQAGRL